MENKSLRQSVFFKFRLFTGLLVMLAGVFLALLAVAPPSNLFARGEHGSKAAAQGQIGNLDQPGLRVIAPYHADISRPLRNAPTIWPPVQRGEEHEANPNPMLPHRHVDRLDPVVQSKFFQTYLRAAIPSPMLTFDGILFPGVGCNCAPPDANGAVGKNHYVQTVNEGYQVFNKVGTSVLGPNSLVSIWSGFGGPCETGGFGDPTVNYDRLADRWVLTEFASGTGGPPITDECVAVSTTGDPTGTWARYGYHLGSNYFDYPKTAVWPDAYYMSMNVFSSSGTSFLGVQPFAFDRARMLVGDPTASIVTTGLAPQGASEDFFMPADLDGLIPPTAGAPNPFVEGPFTGDAYRVYQFHVDFATPGNSTFAQVAAPTSAGFSQLCPTTRACVPEPNGQALDGIGDRLMYRTAYRKFADGHEAIVGNFSVNSSGVAGIRWFEIRDPLGAPALLQERYVSTRFNLALDGKRGHGQPGQHGARFHGFELGPPSRVELCRPIGDGSAEYAHTG